MTNGDSLARKISSLEFQLKVLKGQLIKKKSKKKFSDLYGILKKKGDFTYQEIKEAELKFPGED